MARRPRVFAAGVLYHVIVRGNQRQRTFTAESDYEGYIERLARYRKKYDYVLHAYCQIAWFDLNELESTVDRSRSLVSTFAPVDSFKVPLE
jgi:hypothetical protein